jgi:hypothetical protein
MDRELDKIYKAVVVSAWRFSQAGADTVKSVRVRFELAGSRVIRKLSPLAMIVGSRLGECREGDQPRHLARCTFEEPGDGSQSQRRSCWSVSRSALRVSAMPVGPPTMGHHAQWSSAWSAAD